MTSLNLKESPCSGMSHTPCKIKKVMSAVASRVTNAKSLQGYVMFYHYYEKKCKCKQGIYFYWQLVR